jgi:hypothetical protein
MLEDLRNAVRRDHADELASLAKPLHGLQLELGRLQDVA